MSRGRRDEPGKGAQEIREAFRVLDRDGNGFISKQELGMAMRSLGYMPSEVELAIIMQRLDMDEFMVTKEGLGKKPWNVVFHHSKERADDCEP
ncbi:hypothetical protein QYF61_018809 [Mycteria americana]|uniref:EF-hand domain-containing protein n=1 Tax=Mycteria americana TaxID=33587 RepID=A0AAN7RM63_MYCAM|nr:hypothetical protein QYF61_018809 [Mycteria americana]